MRVCNDPRFVFAIQISKRGVFGFASCSVLVNSRGELRVDITDYQSIFSL